MHLADCAVDFAFARLGSSIAARIAIIAITTSNSIRVKPRPSDEFRNVFRQQFSFLEVGETVQYSVEDFKATLKRLSVGPLSTHPVKPSTGRSIVILERASSSRPFNGSRNIDPSHQIRTALQHIIPINQALQKGVYLLTIKSGTEQYSYKFLVE